MSTSTKVVFAQNHDRVTFTVVEHHAWKEPFAKRDLALIQDVSLLMTGLCASLWQFGRKGQIGAGPRQSR
ncbi:MAG: hypothetical protein AMJ94_11705 [Deltaproteobacteria bacterium SM23_61]|nr:MAG: hypothetical protein AMJ94_11705 [Deltaproteobacteria bacterium SM23_61]